MSGEMSYEHLIAEQRKEKKDLQAKTQKMKHAIPKGDKKKKKEITAEISILLAELDLRHEKELTEYESENGASSSLTAHKNETNVILPLVKHSEPNNGEESFLPKAQLEDCNFSSDSIPQNAICQPKASEELHVMQKLTKAQKRRNKKALVEKEREKAIAEEEINNLTSLRNLESEKIKTKLFERNLVIHEVQSDGNCLYKAIEHQLSTLNLQPMTVEDLRQSTSKYMLLHMKDFIPFLTNAETGDPMTEEQYIVYCQDIATTSVWGGHVEVQVLSHVCGQSIEVIQADGPSVIAGSETASPKLLLSYHRHVYGLGEHYNSVIPYTNSEGIR